MDTPNDPDKASKEVVSTDDGGPDVPPTTLTTTPSNSSPPTGKCGCACSLIREFRTFLLHGPAIDMAVSLVLVAALVSLVRSFLQDILMPLLGAAVGDSDLTNRFWLVGSIPGDYNGSRDSYASLREAGVAVIGYGHFLMALFNLLLLIIIGFWLVKCITVLRRRQRKRVSEQTNVLKDIREALRHHRFQNAT